MPLRARLREAQRRHQEAVDQVIKDLRAAGYSVEGQNVLARIPEFPNRFYDIVAVAPGGGRLGIEVKTTIGESFRISDQQMRFDVQAVAGKATTVAGPIQGVSYVGVSFGGSVAAYFRRLDLAANAKAAGVEFTSRSQ